MGLGSSRILPRPATSRLRKRQVTRVCQARDASPLAPTGAGVKPALLHHSDRLAQSSTRGGLGHALQARLMCLIGGPQCAAAPLAARHARVAREGHDPGGRVAGWRLDGNRHGRRGSGGTPAAGLGRDDGQRVRAREARRLTMFIEHMHPRSASARGCAPAIGMADDDLSVSDWWVVRCGHLGEGPA